MKQLLSLIPYAILGAVFDTLNIGFTTWQPWAIILIVLTIEGLAYARGRNTK